MMHIDKDTPEEAVAEAVRICSTEVVMNLTLSFRMELPATSSGLLSTFREEAERWQESRRPQSLHLNHGEYMYAHGDWLDSIEGELRRKPSSNRACVSLVNSAPIFASGDGPLPSFMLVQFGFSGPARDTLYVTSYYRALEVTAFLPLNVTEMALVAERLADRFPSIERAEVTMHSFRAHANHGFRAHQRSKLDMATPTQIHRWVVDRNYSELADLLQEKSAPASIIEDSGLTILWNEAQSAGWQNELLDELERALGLLTALRTMREVGTHENRIDSLQRQLTERLLRCAEMIRHEQ
ncbi:hypothetical protein [Diaminobutyricibacter sp. McL0608]|uniref:hypothetical protein n=1 Tax=Leifsonia sp. McL0608 TaxID=3143537 RepID=UPI0031F31E79